MLSNARLAYHVHLISFAIFHWQRYAQMLANQHQSEPSSHSLGLAYLTVKPIFTNDALNHRIIGCLFEGARDAPFVSSSIESLLALLHQDTDVCTYSTGRESCHRTYSQHSPDLYPTPNNELGTRIQHSIVHSLRRVCTADGSISSCHNRIETL